MRTKQGQMNRFPAIENAENELGAPGDNGPTPYFPGFGDLVVNPDIICEALAAADVLDQALASLDGETMANIFPNLSI